MTPPAATGPGTFPACKHRKRKRGAAISGGLRWLAAEPFRPFFFLGALWSIIGVLLWPLYYRGHLGFYPSVCHARLMIEAFGGAFVAGFLGTAGPRMASAPKLTPAELLVLLTLHGACAISHLLLRHALGDILFVVFLACLLAGLGVRALRYGGGAPPPQLLLVYTGLACGIAGATLLARPATLMDPAWARLASLLLYQGLLLPPVLGIGSFLFPRILGRGFGEGGTPREQRRKLLRTIAAAVLLVGGIFIEAFLSPIAGGVIRAGAFAGYLLVEIRWSRSPEEAPRGTLAAGLMWSLITGFSGLALAGFFTAGHTSIEHLLYIGGFGTLILIVGSRVLFGHSGELAGFSARSWWLRLFILLAIMAAATRMIPAFVPRVTVSHHQYAALLWFVVAFAWLLWHRRRFVKREKEEEEQET